MRARAIHLQTDALQAPVPYRKRVFRSVSRIWIVLDVVGSVLGLLITLPLSIVTGTNALSAWLPDGALSSSLLGIVAVTMWGAVAISRVSPPLALIIAWAAAVVQMASGFTPMLLDVAVFPVLFATAAWGSQRLLWWGGGSAVGGGLIAGLYVGLQQLASTVAFGGVLDTAARVSTLTVLGGTSIGFALIIAWGAGLLSRLAWRERETRTARLQAETLAAEEAERTRIARDMHDIVAHSLAVVIAQADGARYAAVTKPELAQQAMVTIAQTSRAALSDVRMLLTQLRHRQGDGPQPTLADLEMLFAQVRQAGVEARVTIDPMPPGEPPGSIQLAVYRILQEALTNALRHGEGDVDVRMSWWIDNVELEVRNRVSAAAAATASGHGLVGMRERAQLVGGALQAHTENDWFVVRAMLPIGRPA